MTLDPVVIDSCVFTQDRGFIYWLKTYHGRKIISSVTYAELQVYFLGAKKKEPSFFDGILRASRIEVEWFKKDHALITGMYGAESDSFAEDFRDFMIGSHASIAPWIVVTYNVSDFHFLNGRAKSPDDFRKEHDNSF